MKFNSVLELQAAMDATFGVKEAIALGVKPFRSLRGLLALREAYAAITGDAELTRLGTGGIWSRAALAATNIEVASFPSILLNALNKRVIQDYAEVGMRGLDRVYTVADPIGDYKTQSRVRLGYLDDLSDVAEGGVYQEFDKPTDDKIQYAVTKKGNVLSVTEETIYNDDLGKLKGFSERMARAGRRTLKQFITTKFESNPNYGPDATAVFHGDHNNLGTDPLSPAALTAARALLVAQQEKDSDKPLGLALQWIMFAPARWADARAINQTDKWPTGPGTFEANPWFRAFGDNNEGLIENELLSDANDWYYGCWPSACPVIEIGFLDGFQAPQIYLDNSPQSGSVGFTKDEMRFKVKFPFGGAWLDYRGVGKNAVA
ncbi:MAG: hypothetical protein LAO06_02560 [Acidobacteriia bacterium]|nr:hypothetical protein [Terriglobia bacterium]